MHLHAGPKGGPLPHRRSHGSWRSETDCVWALGNPALRGGSPSPLNCHSTPSPPEPPACSPLRSQPRPFLPSLMTRGPRAASPRTILLPVVPRVPRAPGILRPPTRLHLAARRTSAVVAPRLQALHLLALLLWCLRCSRRRRALPCSSKSLPSMASSASACLPRRRFQQLGPRLV